MSRRVLLSLATCCALFGLGAAWTGATAAAASGRTSTVSMTTEAWYQEAPPCVSLVDCSAAPAGNPYPDDTVHVSISGGQETARTYLAFSVRVPAGGRLSGGALTLPLDTSSSDGTLSPDQALVSACLVTASFQPVRASLAAPPRANCKVSSPAKYDAKHSVFTVDLSPFSAGWGTGTAALALLPSPTAQQPLATWHVAFYATKTATKTSQPITATLTYAAPQRNSKGTTTGTGTGSSATTTTSSGSSSGTGGTGSGFGSSIPSFTGTVGGIGSFGAPAGSSSTTTTTTVTRLSTQTGTQPVSRVQPFVGGFAGPGFAYPLVWALPLVFLAGFGAIGRILTKDLYRRGI